ncbi:winged helix-turn-helix transcriptional regulator [Thiofilum flexile]|uniref:winged helix-turn-helix transcriptional regulator n=1 Tax=Thiofilum flexile TaxID=125627 RepID=UPI002481074F|nr:helix-turn-helix domain-containing protein [Thiofilum flexile]
MFDSISNKWTMFILDRLRDQPVRFNQLLREIEGISQKMLSQTLKTLERDGLITRTAFPTVPVTVEYAITPLGQTLSSTVHVLIHWAEHNGDEILAARAAYDAKNKQV